MEADSSVASNEKPVLGYLDWECSHVIRSHWYLKELDQQLNFYQGRQLLWIPVCFTVGQTPSEKGSTLTGKNLLPRGGGGGANSFCIEKTPFQKGDKTILSVASPESIFILNLSCIVYRHINDKGNVFFSVIFSITSEYLDRIPKP